jgi:hypothetical protein
MADRTVIPHSGAAGHLLSVDPGDVSQLLISFQSFEAMGLPDPVDLAHEALFAVSEVIPVSCIGMSGDHGRSQTTENDCDNR